MVLYPGMLPACRRSGDVELPITKARDCAGARGGVQRLDDDSVGQSYLTPAVVGENRLGNGRRPGIFALVRCLTSTQFIERSLGISPPLDYRPRMTKTPAAIAKRAMKIPSPEKLRFNNGMSPVTMSQIPKKSMPRLLGSFIESSIQCDGYSTMVFLVLEVRSPATGPENLQGPDQIMLRPLHPVLRRAWGAYFTAYWNCVVLVTPPKLTLTVK